MAAARAEIVKQAATSPAAESALVAPLLAGLAFATRGVLTPDSTSSASSPCGAGADGGGGGGGGGAAGP